MFVRVGGYHIYLFLDNNTAFVLVLGLFLPLSGGFKMYECA